MVHRSIDDGKLLVVRADASPGMGTGHLLRCLALAQEWKDRGGNVILITACKVASLLERFGEEKVEVVPLGNAYPDSDDLRETRRVRNNYPGAWLVLDGYHFDIAYQSAVAEGHSRLLVIDDNAHLLHYQAEIIVNQNIHAWMVASRYPPACTLLLGPDYALLRREFRISKVKLGQQPQVARRILVLLGGSDPANITRKVLAALSAVTIPGLEVVVLLGPANEHRAGLEAVVQNARYSVRLEQDARNVARWMLWSDLVIAGAGTVTWELCRIGVPGILLTLADNQRLSAEAVSAAGLAVWAGDAEDIRPEELARVIGDLAHDQIRRAEMSKRCRRLVDGRGPQRVVDWLLSKWGEDHGITCLASG